MPAARDGSDTSSVGDDRRHDGRPGLPIMKSKVAVVASHDDDAVRPGDVGGAALELHARVRRKRVRTQQVQRPDQSSPSRRDRAHAIAARSTADRAAMRARPSTLQPGGARYSCAKAAICGFGCS